MSFLSFSKVFFFDNITWLRCSNRAAAVEEEPMDEDSEDDDSDTVVSVYREAPTSMVRRVLPAVALSLIGGAVSAYVAMAATENA